MADNEKISELTKRDDGWGSSYEKKVEYETQGWLSKYLQQNLIKTLGTLTTVLGMIGIYAYHLHIEYFPVFDLKSTASLVFAAAYVGVFLLIFFAFFIVIPALYLGGTYIEDIVDEEKFPTAKGKIVTSFVIAGVGFFLILFLAFLLAENNLNLQWVWLILLPVFIVSLVKDEKGFSIPSKDQLVKQNSNEGIYYSKKFSLRMKQSNFFFSME